MTAILVLSPHLDDAAFSVGPVLAEFSSQATIVVATAFTKSVPKPGRFALACQLDKGLSEDVDYMAIRRQEDAEWSRRIGVQFVHGAFSEAPHRGYESAETLFGPILVTDKLNEVLGQWLAELIQTVQPSTIVCPVGVGSHVDHTWVRKVALAALGPQLPLIFYKDQPYSAKLDALSVQSYLGHANAWIELNVSISRNSIAKALVAAQAYQTQIPFQFGSVKKMRQTLRGAWMQHLSFFQSDAATKTGNIFSRTKLQTLCPD